MFIGTKPTLTLLLLLVLNAAHAQNFAWAVSMGSTETSAAGDDGGYAVKTDNAGNVYTVGRFTGTADFDPGPGVFKLISKAMYVSTSERRPSTESYIQKLGADGKFLWAKQLVGDSGSAAYGLVIDGSGNLYITGFFRGSKDFDPGTGVYYMTAVGNADIYVLKLDANGNFLWAKTMGGTGNEGGFAIGSDASNNVYVAGRFEGVVDLDPSSITKHKLNSAGAFDGFVMKLDSGGNFIWAAQLGGPSFDNCSAITLDSFGHLLITGVFAGTCDFDPGTATYNLTTAYGSDDIFVWKLTLSGVFVWAKQMVGTWDASGNGIVTDSAGNIYYVGSFLGTVDFDPGPGAFSFSSSINAHNIIISKLDSAGNYVWAKQIEQKHLGEASCIALDPSSNIYFAGGFEDTIDFDPGVGIYNMYADNSDVFIEKLNNNGNFISAVSMGGDMIDAANSIYVDASASVYCTGAFMTVGDFDPGPAVYNLTSTGGADIFIVKLGQLTTSIPATPSTAVTRKFVSSVILSPNIGNGNMTLIVKASLPTRISWSVIDVTGKVIQRFNQHVIAGTNSYKVEVPQIAGATYFLNGITEKGETFTIPFIKTQ